MRRTGDYLFLDALRDFLELKPLPPEARVEAYRKSQLLDVLHELGPSPLRVVADHIGMRRDQASRDLALLEVKGLVERTTGNSMTRVWRLK